MSRLLSNPRFFSFAAAAVLLAGASGCMLDFDSFETGDAGIDRQADGSPPEDGEAADGDGPPSDADPGADGEVGTDATDDSGGIGAPCDSGADCQSGTCVKSYCTTSCSSDRDCPGSAECGKILGEKRCVIPCPAFDSCDIEGRSDVSCVISNSQPRVGELAERSEACLPDEDGDRVFDALDNCPETANAAQRDRDSDGAGDACDPEPRCHDGASSGTIDFGTIEYPADNFDVPAVVDGNWLPVIGGRDPEAGNTEASYFRQFARLDLDAGEWTSKSELPYIADEQTTAPLADVDAYASTPGRMASSQLPVGRFLVFRADGSIESDGGFGLEVENPVAATTGQGNFVLLGYGEDSEGNLERRLWRYRPDDEAFTRFQTTTVSQKRNWRTVSDSRGTVYFYGPPNPTSTPPQQGRILEIDPRGSFENSHVFEYPTITNDQGDSRPFEPILMTGPGDRLLYAFDRSTGRAATLDLASESASRRSELDLSLPFDVEAAAVDPKAPALVLVGRDDSDDTELRATAIYAACHDALNQFDSDGDSVPNLRDNCPAVPNEDQNDADLDEIGDACDNDADNDGIENVEDTADGNQLSRDTDNDGTDNTEDDDFDGDGIKNSSDRRPFDTDNDGLPNHLDSDDDGDGYADSLERSDTYKSDPLDPLSFPNSGFVAFVERNSNEELTVKRGPLAELESADAPFSPSDQPRRPKIAPDGEGVVALSGAPGQTTEVLIWSEETGQSSKRDLGRDLRAVDLKSVEGAGDPVDLTVAKRTSADASSWHLASYDLDSEEFESASPSFGALVSIDRYDDDTAFLAGAEDCAGCLSIFRVADGSTDPTFLAAPPGHLRLLRYEPPRYAVSTTLDEEDGARESAFVQIGGNSREEIRGPGFTAVHSIVPLDSGNHLLVSAKRSTETYDLWLFNDRIDRWFPVLRSSSDLIEIDWIR